MALETLLTVEQAAAALQVNPETIRRMLRDGRLRGLRPGGRRFGWRIAESELARFVAGEPEIRPGPPRQGPATGPTVRDTTILVGNVRGLAEQARARGDVAAAGIYEAMLDTMTTSQDVG